MICLNDQSFLISPTATSRRNYSICVWARFGISCLVVLASLGSIGSCAKSDETDETSPHTQAAPGPERSSTPATLNDELSRMFALIQHGRTGLARLQLNTYLKRHPDDGQAHFLLGLSYHQEYRYGTAKPHFEQAAELSPDYHPVYHFLGWCLYYIGDADGARQAIETHLSFVPNEGDSHFVLGLLALDEHDLEEAKARLLKAIELQTGRPGRQGTLANAHTKLGELYARLGRFEEARAQHERAIELFPDHYQAMYQLYRTLLRLGEDDEADRVLARHLETKARMRPHTSFPQ